MVGMSYEKKVYINLVTYVHLPVSIGTKAPTDFSPSELYPARLALFSSSVKYLYVFGSSLRKLIRDRDPTPVQNVSMGKNGAGACPEALVQFLILIHLVSTSLWTMGKCCYMATVILKA